jgi:hypothetical protein
LIFIGIDSDGGSDLKLSLVVAVPLAAVVVIIVVILLVLWRMGKLKVSFLINIGELENNG